MPEIRLQGRRPLPRPVGPQGDGARRGRDARPHGPARRVQRRPAPRGRPHHGLAAHDHPDGGAHRDPHRPRRRRALGQLQHLLHPGPRRRRRRRRPHRHHRRPAGRAGLRLEGRDARGVLVVHRPGPAVARRRWPQHDPRRRWRRHHARAQGHRVREGRGRPCAHRRRLRRVEGRPRAAHRLGGEGAHPLDRGRRRDQGRHRGDHHGCASPLRHVRQGPAALPGDQRQRLGHQVEVRQPLRLPALARRRHQPRHRRDARRQDRDGRRLRRRRQGLRGVAEGSGLPGDRRRGRPDLRAAGGDGGLPGHHDRAGRRPDRHLHHRHRQQGHHLRRA